MNRIFAKAINLYLSGHKGLNKHCYKGIFLNLIESTLAGTFYFLSIYFVDVLYLNISIAGFLISFYGLGTIIGGLIGGKLSDRISPSSVSIVSLFIQSITFLCLVKIKSPYILAIDLFILGLATYSFITSNSTWILSYCINSDQRLKAINSMTVASNLGIGLSAIAIGELASYSFNYVFLFSGMLLSVLTVFLIFQRMEINNNSYKEAKIPYNENHISITVNEEINKYRGTVTLALLSLFFTGMIVNQLSTTYSIFIKDTFPSLGIHAFSLLFFVNTILVVIFQNHLVNYFANANKIIMIGIGSFMIGIGMLLLNFSFMFSITLISCLIYSIGEMIFFSMVQLYVYQKGEDGKKGSSLGKYRMVYASSRFIGPSIGGAIYHYAGASALWYISGLIGTIFLISCYKFKSLA